MLHRYNLYRTKLLVQHWKKMNVKVTYKKIPSLFGLAPKRNQSFWKRRVMDELGFRLWTLWAGLKNSTSTPPSWAKPGRRCRLWVGSDLSLYFMKIYLFILINKFSVIVFWSSNSCIFSVWSSNSCVCSVASVRFNPYTFKF